MSNSINLAPSPVSLIESLRNIGYSLETAVADIIDNSITADADKIDIRFSWKSGNPWLAIIDNGMGMIETELIDAMRFGSMNPLETRSLNDLGRFGLGLKTASFSQCRHLTVLSKKDTKISCCEWDLEKLSQNKNIGWCLTILDTVSIQKRDILNRIYNDYLNKNNSGTIILWEKIDRIKELIPLVKQESHFNSLIDDTRRHLELTFHRFLSPARGKKKIVIAINSDNLIAFNPFNPRTLATQELEEQKIVLDGDTIVVQPYVLPHHNKVSKQEYDKYSGDGGYLNNQGFYVYRNRRLIIKGTWFRLIKKEELNKLIRVRIDIPNSLDHLWKIDVKKSHAFPPESIRAELKKVINRIEVSGRRVYQQRGKKLSTNIESPVWNRIVSAGNISYHINRRHPLITNLQKSLTNTQIDLLGKLFTMFESSFPIDMFYNDIASKSELIENPGFKEKDLVVLLDIFLQSWNHIGNIDEVITAKILSTDPFFSNRKITMNIIKNRGFVSE